MPRRGRPLIDPLFSYVIRIQIINKNIKGPKGMNPEEEKLAEIFMPHNYRRQKGILKKKTKLVHYTNAEAATNIIKNKEFWLRESSCMNDYLEITHGYECIKDAYENSLQGETFRNALNDLHNDITIEIQNSFNGWFPSLENDTYLGCFSEHDPNEDTIGRLSMWRAYSQTQGVALVMNSEVFFNESGFFKGLYASTVAYEDNEGIKKYLAEIATNINENRSFLERLERQSIVGYVVNLLRFAALCTKHPGFKEEKEWRLVYTPKIENTQNLIKEVRSVKNVPQTVYKIPLKNAPNEGLVGLEIPDLINRVIIGPTDYALAMKKAFVSLLRDGGVKDPDERVFISDIPIR